MDRTRPAAAADGSPFDHQSDSGSSEYHGPHALQRHCDTEALFRYDLETSGENIVLFHVSEEPGIGEFIPRPSKYTREPVVWAVHEEKIRNYLVPRGCPRVTYFADAHTVAADSERLLGKSMAVVAIEASWWNRIRSFTLYCYHLPPDTFECIDDCAGYFVSREAVRPVQVEVIDDPIAALLRRGVELRIVPALGPLRDAVVASTLQFSIIRMPKAFSTSLSHVSDQEI